MEPVKGVIYDKDGQRTFTTNVDILSLEMSDKLLISSYRYTIYQKTLFKEVQNLKEKGIDIKQQGYQYEPELIDNSINSMEPEIINRFGQEFYDKLEQKIFNEDLEFLKNKPKNLL